MQAITDLEGEIEKKIGRVNYRRKRQSTQKEKGQDERKITVMISAKAINNVLLHIYLHLSLCVHKYI